MLFKAFHIEFNIVDSVLDYIVTEVIDGLNRKKDYHFRDPCDKREAYQLSLRVLHEEIYAKVNN